MHNFDMVEVGAQDRTNVFEMYLKDPKTGSFLKTEEDKVIAQTLSVAFRDALASCHGINAEELGFGIKQIEIEQEVAYAISIYDKASGGAGFSSTAHQYLDQLFKQAKSILQCDDGCDSACHSCLLSYDTRFISHKLNRIKALEYLESISNLLELPEHAKHLLPEASYCGQSIDERVAHYFLRGYKQVRLYLQGDPKDWDISARLFEQVSTWNYNGNDVLIAVSENSLSNLDDISKLQLMTINSFSKVELSTYSNSSDDFFLSNNYLLQMIEDYNSGLPVTLATTSKDTYVPNSDLWQVDSDEITVESTKAELLDLKPLDIDRLKPDSENDTREFNINNELNGSIKDFGAKFWSFMRDYSKLNEKIKNEVDIKKIVYSDRYIRSPLTALLVGEIVYALKSIYGTQWSNPDVILKIEEATNERMPRKVEHNWQNSNIQEKVITALYRDLGLKPDVLIYPYKDIPKEKRIVDHRRYLEITWSDDSCTSITLDQGIGFMQPSKNSSSRLFDLNFNASPQHQADRLVALSEVSSAKIEAVGDSHPAYIAHNKGKGS